jgi:hypothetical protein
MTPNVCADCPRVGCPVAGEISAYAKSCAHKPKEQRVCVREEYQEIETPPYYIDNGVAIELPWPMQLLKVWTFHYSDGTTEQLVQTGAL